MLRTHVSRISFSIANQKAKVNSNHYPVANLNGRGGGGGGGGDPHSLPKI